MQDPKIRKLIAGEEKRQKEGLEMIPSENYVSKEVRYAVGSVLENKYAEGYPGKRYYTGNEFVDQIENLCIDRTKKLFGVPFVNVQPYSGSPANLEIFGAICNPGDTVLSQLLSSGGHLSMGQAMSATGKHYSAKFYHLTPEGEIDWDELYTLARKFKPKIIWSGGTGYTKVFKWEKYAAIAEEIGAYFVADISHIAGLIAGGTHPSPVPFAHVVMTTTHKTLRGPRGALIMVTQKGLQKDPELGEKVNKSVFPGHQGGPHINKIAGIAVALNEANTNEFKTYAKQIVTNSCALAKELIRNGFVLIGDGTENHMIWIDLRNKNIDGWQAHVTLEVANIYGNKQTIPNDPKPPYYPSGYRLGTPAITTRGMKEKEMKMIAGFINRGVEIAQRLKTKGLGSEIKEEDQDARKLYKQKLKTDKELLKLKTNVTAFAKKYGT